MKKIRPLYLILLLNAGAAIFYFSILTQLVNIQSIPIHLFSTGDAQEYYEYSKWIAGNSEYCSPIRTFFYPLVIFVTTTLFGNYSLWIVQFIFWLLSCNFVFYTIHLLTNNKTLSIIGFILCCTNVSLIGYSSHALSETTVLFLLFMLIYLIAKNIHQITAIHTLLKLLFIVSMLAATKPLYQAVWYISFLIIIFISYKELKKIKNIALFICAITPVIIQKGINLSTHHTLSSTEIADSNLKKYLYRKVKHFTDYGTINNFDTIDDSFHFKELSPADKLSKYEAIYFLVRHPKETSLTIVDNWKDNLGMGYPYSNTPENKDLLKWSQNINNKIMYLHLIAFITWLVFIGKNLRKLKNHQNLFILLSGLLLFYILGTSGLVFWSGDRLIAPATALWICCYLIMGQTLFLRAKRPTL